MQEINEASLGNTHDVYEDVDDGFDNVVVHEWWWCWNGNWRNNCLTCNWHPRHFLWHSSLVGQAGPLLPGAPTPRPTIAEETFSFKAMDLLRNIFSFRKTYLPLSLLRPQWAGLAISSARQVLHMPCQACHIFKDVIKLCGVKNVFQKLISFRSLHFVRRKIDQIVKL